MRDEYYIVQIVASSYGGLPIDYRTVIRAQTLTHVLHTTMNDCYTTTRCHEIMSINIRRWEALTAEERKEVCYLEQQRKK